MNNMVKKRKTGFTLIEICITVVILSILFGSAQMLVSYANKQAAKGAWLQQSLMQLRNGTRRIRIELAKASSPKAVINKKVYSYSEFRKIVNGSVILEENPKELGNKHYFSVVIPYGGKKQNFGVPKGNKAQTLMYFPVCTPEDNGSGKITWFCVKLKRNASTGLGDLCLEEREGTYSVTGSNDESIKNSIFGLWNRCSFDQVSKTKEKVLIGDVKSCSLEEIVATGTISIQANSTFLKKGEKAKNVRKTTTYHLINLSVKTQHPKDGLTILTDRLAVLVKSTTAAEDSALINENPEPYIENGQLFSGDGSENPISIPNEGETMTYGGLTFEVIGKSDTAVVLKNIATQAITTISLK